MKQLGPEHRRLLGIGAAALIAVLYVVGLLLPLNAKTRELSSEMESLKGAVERSQMMYHAAQAAESDVAALQEDMRALMFPDGDVRVSMVRELERLAAETGLTITSIRPEQPERAGGAMKYPATFRVEAAFSDLVLLMFELEQPARRFWVEGVEISADRKGQAKLQATFYVAAYAQFEEDEAEDAET